MSRSEPNLRDLADSLSPERLAQALATTEGQTAVAQFREALHVQRELLALQTRIHAMKRLDALAASEDDAVACRAATAILRSTTREAAPAPARPVPSVLLAAATTSPPVKPSPPPAASQNKPDAFRSRFHDLAHAPATPEPLRRVLTGIEDQLLTDLRFASPLDHPELPFSRVNDLASRTVSQGFRLPLPEGGGWGEGPRAPRSHDD